MSDPTPAGATTIQPTTGSTIPIRLAVLTSGGDAQGMNAALRAVVRTALTLGAQPFAVYEGLQGLVDGGPRIRAMAWGDVGSILHRGGTVIGTARSKDFRTRDGLRTAARNLLNLEIDRLVVIGGDGSLSGAAEFHQEWPILLKELVEAGEIDADVAARHPHLMISGMVGSIDNDLVGFDMTIGTDSALHRIVDAVDAITSTAASHQRSFVVEVMGRRCGYLPLMAAIAGGCDAVFVPEDPAGPGWADRLCEGLRAGRAAGRRDGLVVVAEGAVDTEGRPIRADDVMAVIRERLGEDTRVTTLGHVQRGGAPSAFDRWMSTLLGHSAAQEILTAETDRPPVLVGLRHSRISHRPLLEAVAATRDLNVRMSAGQIGGAVEARGGTFAATMRVFSELVTPPTAPLPETAKRVGVVHVGGLAPGMNSAVYAAVRLGVARGMRMIGVTGGLPGLAAGNLRELSWEEVDGWIAEGGAILGTHRHTTQVEDFYALSRAVEQAELDALMVIGGYNAYASAAAFVAEQARYPALRLPIVCVPASIDNNLPGTDHAIGADTALGVAVEALDRIKQSAGAQQRCFIVELMGRTCGYLTAMAGLATGAERVYLHEIGVDLGRLQSDLQAMRSAFAAGRRLFVVLRNEDVNSNFTTDFLARLFEQESGGLFDVRSSILGHVQQGGQPSPFDRILAVRLVSHALDQLAHQFASSTQEGIYLGTVEGELRAMPLARVNDLVDLEARRPVQQWWLAHLPVLSAVADPPPPPSPTSESVNV
jgi:6-phosphofructokinase 1